jgi:hypothetical protein
MVKISTFFAEWWSGPTRGRTLENMLLVLAPSIDWWISSTYWVPYTKNVVSLINAVKWDNRCQLLILCHKWASLSNKLQFFI